MGLKTSIATLAKDGSKIWKGVIMAGAVVMTGLGSLFSSAAVQMILDKIKPKGN